MSPLRAFLAARAAPNGHVCGVCALKAYPGAPRVQALLRDYLAAHAWRFGGDADAGLVQFAREMAAAHGIAELQSPADDALGIAEINGRQTVVIYTGGAWWMQTHSGVRRCPDKFIKAIFEVA